MSHYVEVVTPSVRSYRDVFGYGARGVVNRSTGTTVPAVRSILRLDFDGCYYGCESQLGDLAGKKKSIGKKFKKVVKFAAAVPTAGATLLLEKKNREKLMKVAKTYYTKVAPVLIGAAAAGMGIQAAGGFAKMGLGPQQPKMGVDEFGQPISLAPGAEEGGGGFFGKSSGGWLDKIKSMAMSKAQAFGSRSSAGEETSSALPEDLMPFGMPQQEKRGVQVVQQTSPAAVAKRDRFVEDDEKKPRGGVGTGGVILALAAAAALAFAFK